MDVISQENASTCWRLALGLPSSISDMWLSVLFSVGVSVCVSFASAPNGPWNAFNLAPASRIVTPTAIYKQAGSVKDAHALLTSTGEATLSENNSFVSLDFGKEVINIVRLES